MIPEMITRFLQVGHRSVERLLECRANIEVIGFVNILLDLRPRGAGLHQYVGIIITAYPVVVAGAIKAVGFAEWADEAKMELGLFRHILDNPGDLKECIVITYLQRAADAVGPVDIAAGGTFIDHN